MFSEKSSPVVLCILDGWGIAKDRDTDVIIQNTNNWKGLLEKYPHSVLNASEEAVGLPKGQMGNSEVGHMTIGLGRVIIPDLPRINTAIEQNELKHKIDLKNFIAQLKNHQGTCHLIGLLSSGGVHSHLSHFIAILKIVQEFRIPIRIHAFLDGRDTPPKNALAALEDLKPFLKDETQIVTISGRYYGMDRDQRWERTEQAYKAIVKAQAEYTFKDVSQAIKSFYDQGITDEFIPPCLIQSDTEDAYTGIKNGEGFIMINFRADRVRQILSALVSAQFPIFDSHQSIQWAGALGMCEYSDDLSVYMPAIFPKIPLKESLGEVVSAQGHSQLRLAETEKYAHVTFFFNGGREEPFPNEKRILIPSPDVSTYDLSPEMSAQAITDTLKQQMKQHRYPLTVVNYANPDMVGHSGSIEATKKALLKIDQILKELEQEVLKNNWILIITADHGNAEQMTDSTGQPHTAHTCNPVPFLLISQKSYNLKPKGSLADVAPTILELFNDSTPLLMTGQSLLIKKASSLISGGE